MALPTLVEAISSLSAFARVLNTIPAQGQCLTIGGLAKKSEAKEEEEEAPKMAASRGRKSGSPGRR